MTEQVYVNELKRGLTYVDKSVPECSGVPTLFWALEHLSNLDEH